MQIWQAVLQEEQDLMVMIPFNLTHFMSSLWQKDNKTTLSIKANAGSLGKLHQNRTLLLVRLESWRSGVLRVLMQWCQLMGQCTEVSALPNPGLYTYSPANEKLDWQESGKPQVWAGMSHGQRVDSDFKGDTEAWSVPMGRCAGAACLQLAPHWTRWWEWDPYGVSVSGSRTGSGIPLIMPVL